MQKHIALLGGTFDPVHNGHLQVGQLVLDQLGFDQIIFIPNHSPPHRGAPVASAAQRLEMLQLAVKQNSRFEISTIELDRSGPSYMIDTIELLREPNNTQNNNQDPCFWLILGRDAFDKLPTWHHFEKILTSCSFIVINRQALNNNINNNNNWSENYIKNHVITIDEFNILNNTYKYRVNNKLTNKLNGSVILLNNFLIDLSGTKVREIVHNYYLNKQETLDTLKTQLQNLLPEQVVNYILEQHLYI